MPLVTCPDCQREISDAAMSCVGCGHPFATPDRREGGEALRSLGWCAILLGLVGLIASAAMDTSVESGGEYIAGTYLPTQRVQNLGLMNDKQNWILVSGILMVAGLGLVRIGYVQQEVVRARPHRPAPSAPDTRLVARCVACAIPLTSEQAHHFKGQVWCDHHFDEQVSGVSQTLGAHDERPS
jgi:hypothetical protein